MIEIKDLLLKFNNLLVSGETKKTLIAEIISSAIGVQIKKEDVETKDGTIYLNIKPIYKSEILRKNKEISTRLEEVLGKNHPKSIL